MKVGIVNCQNTDTANVTRYNPYSTSCFSLPRILFFGDIFNLYCIVFTVAYGLSYTVWGFYRIAL